MSDDNMKLEWSYSPNNITKVIDGDRLASVKEFIDSFCTVLHMQLLINVMYVLAYRTVHYF